MYRGYRQHGSFVIIVSTASPKYQKINITIILLVIYNEMKVLIVTTKSYKNIYKMILFLYLNVTSKHNKSCVILWINDVIQIGKKIVSVQVTHGSSETF